MKRALAIVAALAADAAAAQDARVGERLYTRYCTACHGADGTGDGPMGRVLTLDPPDLTQLAARNGGTFPRRRVIWRIDGRDPVLAHGNEMPIYGDPSVRRAARYPRRDRRTILSTRPMALIAFLESLQRQ